MKLFSKVSWFAIMPGLGAGSQATGSIAIGSTIINSNANSAAVGPDVNIAQDLNVMRTLRVLRDLNVSSGVNRGVSIVADSNRVCFPSNTCEMYIDYNGTAFVFGS